MKNVIGLLGGTFDPIHNGHLHIAKQLLKCLPLQQIRFIPCYQSNHRTMPTATAEQRLTMLKLALADQKNMCLDDCEIKRQGISYTIDTLKQLSQKYPSATLCFIIGADAFNNIDTWRQWQSIFDFVHIIVVDRPNEQHAPKLVNLLKKRQRNSSQELLAEDHGGILYCDIEPLPIAASSIRQHPNDAVIQQGLPIAVQKFISQQKLYQQP